MSARTPAARSPRAHHSALRATLLIITIATSQPLAGCASPDRPFGGADASDGSAPDATPATDGSSRSCRAGEAFACAGTVARRCDGTGAPTDCAATGRVCWPGTGCVACGPMTGRCDPARPLVPQRCSADGTGWQDEPACTGAQLCQEGRCVDPCAQAAATHSYIGCEYWPTVTLISQTDPQCTFGVAVSNAHPVPVHVRIEGGGLTAPLERDVAAGAVETIALPWVPALAQSGGHISVVPAPPGRSALVRNGAYHLTTNAPVAVYQFDPLERTCLDDRGGGIENSPLEASLLLPSQVLTGRYVALTRNISGTDVTLNPVSFGDFVSIVATADGTSVRVDSPRSLSASGDGAVRAVGPGPSTYTLDRGDVLQLVADLASVGATCGELGLTGTTIDASHPVAVFVGSDEAWAECHSVGANHLEEQMLPREALGRRYAVTTLREGGARGEPTLVRLLSERAGNTLAFDPPGVHAPVTLGAGELLEFVTTTDFEVRGSAAFAVMELLLQGGAGVGATNIGNPAAALQVPVEQYRTAYDFQVPRGYMFNWLNVVAPAGARLVLDGAPVAGTPAAVGGAGLVVWSVAVTAGVHHLTASDPTQPLGLLVYGADEATAYAYPGGLDLASINPPG